MKAKTNIFKKMRAEWRDILFYCLMIALPVAQFCIFYIGVNANSIALAFQKFVPVKDGEIVTGVKRVWTASTLGTAFRSLGSTTMLNMFKNSFLSYLLINVFSIPLGLLFSFYIYRKLPLHGFIRVLLLMPSIVSSVVIATMYRNFVNDALPELLAKIFGKEYDPDVVIHPLDAGSPTRYGLVIFYNIWISFGVSVLMYSNAMSGISPELIEAAQLDGANSFQEFWHVSLPSIFPTITTFLIVGVAGIFTNQIHLYALFGEASSSLQTTGYYLFIGANKAAKNPFDISTPDLAAFGIILTFIAVPITYLVKWLLEKFGPKED